MSQYHGNDEECPSCALTYGRFRTGFTWREVWLMFWDPPDTPHDEWQRSSRGLVLGKWFEIKQEMWAHHVDVCTGEGGNGIASD